MLADRFHTTSLMKLFHLAFHETEWPDTPVIDLLAAEDADLPTEPGAYVLGTAGETMLVYPWGTSPIYYIGKAEDLRERLSTHRTYIEGAKNDYWERWWWPRYQYGAAFGASCVWFTSQETSAKALEASLVSEFSSDMARFPSRTHSGRKLPEQERKAIRSPQSPRRASLRGQPSRTHTCRPCLPLRGPIL